MANLYVYPTIPQNNPPLTTNPPSLADYLQNKSDPALLDAIPFINDIGRMFSGSVSVNRAGHPNDTLFFWAIEHAEGSLTQAAGSDAVGAVTPNSGLRPGMATTVAEASSGDSSEPWVIWLNGGYVISLSLLGIWEVVTYEDLYS